MLNPTDIQAINQLSEASKAIIWYALKSFNKDIITINGYCKRVDANAIPIRQFHYNTLNHSNELIEVIELTKFSNTPVSLLEHFAPKK